MGLLENMSVIGGADGPTAVFVTGVINTQALVVSVVIGIVLCIFGLKLMRLLSALVGMMIGAGVGAGIAAVAQLEGMVALVVILGCGLVLALLSFFLKRVGAFFSVLCYSFGALITVLPKDSLLFVLIAGVVALILAVAAAIYMEPLVVIVSSVSGGLMAGPAIVSLLGMETKMWIGYIIAAVLAAIGVLVQLLMQSGKIKKKDKQHSQKVKEEASRESDVEKARMILDDDETVEEDFEAVGTDNDDIEILEMEDMDLQ